MAMTNEEIDKAPASRWLDLLIATRVFGKDRSRMVYKLADSIERISEGPEGPDYYSDDIAHAWQVVEKVSQWGKNLSIEYYNGNWIVNYDYTNPVASLIVSASADTAPLAICRAALKAVGAERKPNDHQNR